MRLELSFKVEAGTVNGGEDVSLEAVLRTDADPGTSDQAAAKARDAFDDWLADEESRDPANDVWVEDGEIRTCSSPYGFSVRKPVAEVLADVVWLARTGVGHGSPEYDPKRQFREGEWTYSLRTKIYTLRAELYRHGNAD